MEEIDHDGAQGPHRDVQDRENDESSNSIGHEDYHPIWLENGTDALPNHGVKPTWGFHKVKLRKVETWRHAPGFQL
jgi:hypothetical protein